MLTMLMHVFSISGVLYNGGISKIIRNSEICLPDTEDHNQVINEINTFYIIQKVNLGADLGAFSHLNKTAT